MRIYDIIEKKKLGSMLSHEEIQFVVEGYTNGSLPDYQVSALLMAIYFQGMNDDETAYLTECMARSGQMLDLSAILGIKVDKHSTGGVGDTTTIVLAPLVAAAGVPVAKMSGRGLGHTGGTVDKLESFPGFKVELALDDFIENVNKHGVAVVGQTGNLAPADKKIYALRDVTATVDNVSLIAASIMSKKIAAGSNAIVLDVKCGSGAFMKTLDDAKMLAQTMVRIGKAVGRDTIGIVTDMNQPLGNAIGNSLEVIEAIETLKGQGPEDLTLLTKTFAANMFLLAHRVETLAEGLALADELIASGKAMEKLAEWVASQGGDAQAVKDYSLLPSAPYEMEIVAKESGYVESIETELIGKAALVLGAGRENKESVIDLGVGLIMHKKIGDEVALGDSLATLYYSEASHTDAAMRYIYEAYSFSKDRIEKPQLIYTTIS
ncbi:MAG: pyrimidine-nucleoside phosphorylase [Niameybacter sp.]|uniref:pyrimidine-nucleoside phosphorylase n=1 Tax=Niameybacter sp. TaxID=2033640 RepID=UPI002FC89198